MSPFALERSPVAEGGMAMLTPILPPHQAIRADKEISGWGLRPAERLPALVIRTSNRGSSVAVEDRLVGMTAGRLRLITPPALIIVGVRGKGMAFHLVSLKLRLRLPAKNSAV